MALVGLHHPLIRFGCVCIQLGWHAELRTCSGSGEEEESWPGCRVTVKCNLGQLARMRFHSGSGGLLASVPFCFPHVGCVLRRLRFSDSVFPCGHQAGALAQKCTEESMETMKAESDGEPDVLKVAAAGAQLFNDRHNCAPTPEGGRPQELEAAYEHAGTGWRGTGK